MPDIAAAAALALGIVTQRYWFHCTECVIFTMDIHPNFDYSIHSNLLLYAVIPVTFFVQTLVYR